MLEETMALDLQKVGIVPVDVEYWAELFDPRTDEERELDEWQDDMRATLEDARLDYGGI